MGFPLMNKRARRGVNVPELSGGLNLRDSLNLVNDNQLTDAVNVWFKDGVLKTRPGFVQTSPTDGVTPEHPNETDYTIEAFKVHRDITRTTEAKNLKAVKLILTSLQRQYYKNNESTNDTPKGFCILFAWCGEENIKLPSIENTTENARLKNMFVISRQKTIYCFTSISITEDGEEYKSDYRIYSLAEDAEEWEEIDESELYAPTVYAHCKRGTGAGKFEGTQIEGFNLLSRYYKMIYSAYNENDVDTKHPMRYSYGFPLPQDEEGNVTFTGTLTAEVMSYPLDDDGNIASEAITVTHTVCFDETDDNCIHETDDFGDIWYENDGVPTDGLYMYARKNYFGFEAYTAADTPVQITSDWHKTRNGSIDDNITVTLATEADDTARAKVFNMTRTEWFGGATAGINGGTRLFLGGNTEESNKNLVIWSALNNPLYFSENCYMYAGKADEQVTAFGKQDSMLVIFKRSETYFTQYTQSDSITAESLTTQSTVDYTASSVYFPLTQIHTVIGCDCPDTVQLCRNRLVWASSDGKVYTLVTASQYSERNIFEVGEMMERRLRTENRLSYATACDFEGHYILVTDNRAYLMDYNSYGYQYIYSHAKNEDANIKIPWWYWELPSADESGSAVISGQLIRFLCGNHENTSGICFYTEILSDETAEIPASLTTKLFDFGAAGYRKNVDSVQLSLGNNGGEPITVDFVTDCGTVSEEITLTGNDTENYTAGYLSSVALNPSIRSVVRFGVRLSSEGGLAVGGIALNYRMLGGAR